MGKSTSVSGAPDNSFVGTTRSSWLRRAVRNRHCHAIEQASRRWRGGRRDDSARKRRKILISTQAERVAKRAAEAAAETARERAAADATLAAARLAREEARVEAQRAAAEVAEQRGAELENELASARSLLRRLRGVLGAATRSRAAAAVARARAVGRGARNRVRRARERFRK